MSKSLTFQNPWSGEVRQVPGMGLHRFALKIDCGKRIPEDGAAQPVRIHPDLVRLAELHLACSFQDDIGAID